MKYHRKASPYGAPKIVRVIATMSAIGAFAGVTVVPANAQDAASFDFRTVEELNAKARVAGENGEQPAYRFMVTFNNMTGLDKERRMELLDNITREYSSDASYVKEMFNGAYVVELDPPVPPEKVPSLRGTLESKAEINRADIDRIQFSQAMPNDEFAQRQWHLNSQAGAKVDQAWDQGADGKDSVVAVVDTGITRHPDLDSKILPGFDMISSPVAAGDNDSRDNNPADEGDWNAPNQCFRGSPGSPSSWHGTHVAGIAAAMTNNRQGVAGVAPEAKVLPVRALGRCGGFTSDIADGIAWAAGYRIRNLPVNPNPADVINLSLGGNTPVCQPEYQQAINYAIKAGSIVAVAAGNEDAPTENVQPANCRGVITVGATGPEGYRARYSNFGDEVDLGAPGGNMNPTAGGATKPEQGILSTVNSGERRPERPAYSYMEGTSMATPVVAGVIALMRGINPELSSEEARRILRETAAPFAAEPGDSRKTNGMGAGNLDANAAVCATLKTVGKECRDAD